MIAPIDLSRVDVGALPADELLALLNTTPKGLPSATAAARLPANLGAASTPGPVSAGIRLFASQFLSPITLILIASALLSLYVQAIADASIILFIIGVGALLGFWQEYSASNALSALLARVKVRATVQRDGQDVETEVERIVPGDILVLQAGSTIPADCRLLESEDLFVNESALTGESFPVEKQPGRQPDSEKLALRKNMVFQGTHVVSGTARAVVVRTGAGTELGKISHHLQGRYPETEFERGIRLFSLFLMKLTLALILVNLVIHLALGRPLLEALMFTLALGFGLTPQLLPAVISVNLARGASRLAASGVIVRRLASMENFGSMDVLCCDKTGTLTEGIVEVEACQDFTGTDHPAALAMAGMNAAFETGFPNPIDEALRRKAPLAPGAAEKLDEIPYDFLRRRLGVLVRMGARRVFIVKGALVNVLAVCTRAETAQCRQSPLNEVRPEIMARFEELGKNGYRVIALAWRDIDRDRVTHADESDMVFAGLLVLRDPPRQGIQDTLRRLENLGVTLKIVTGDNHVVASSLAARLHLDGNRVLTGREIAGLTDESLQNQAVDTAVFAEIEPNQKERIVQALKRAGRVVGYLGDGINDATALRAADVGISVDEAVDVAREAADIILLRHDLNVLLDGIRQGRATFANTLKYIYMATSANFGNMFSMAGISLFLPFLPLLPKQILLTNLLTDLPEMTIATDRVDKYQMDRPQRWDIRAIQRFMVVFGLLSSLFDILVFTTLFGLFRASPELFRTGWFVESVISACVVVLIVRSRQPLWTSRPSWPLLATTLLAISITLALPFSGLDKILGFTPIPAPVLASMLAIVLAYATAAEFVKRWFYMSLKG